MKLLRGLAALVPVVALAVSTPALQAADKTPGTITVSFGAGLNTGQPGNVLNHHIIPQEFKVRITRAKRLNGEVVVVPATVNFVVGGFHWIWVYRDGVELEEVEAHVPAAGTFVNYEVVVGNVSNVFAKGVFPGNPPAFADAAPFPLSPTQNRAESIGFSRPGRYLVICNVRPHFLDGMYAWVRVVEEEDDEI